MFIQQPFAHSLEEHTALYLFRFLLLLPLLLPLLLLLLFYYCNRFHWNFRFLSCLYDFLRNYLRRSSNTYRLSGSFTHSTFLSTQNFLYVTSQALDALFEFGVLFLSVRRAFAGLWCHNLAWPVFILLFGDYLLRLMFSNTFLYCRLVNGFFTPFLLSPFLVCSTFRSIHIVIFVLI